MTCSDNIIKEFKKRPYLLKESHKKVCKRLSCSKEDIEKAKKSMKEEETKTIEELYKLHKIDSSKYEISSYYSSIKKDGISSTVHSTLKEKEVTDFSEIIKSVKEVIESSPKKSIKVPFYNVLDDGVAFIYISDDHVGVDLSDSIYGSSYTQEVYAERLKNLIPKGKFSKVHVVSLGDQLDGWNKKTTRENHILQSLSNRDQFKMYFGGRVEFYDALLSSGISKDYYIHDLENSNHSGNDFSLIANHSLHLYVKYNYPGVFRKSYTDPFFHLIEGNDLFLFTHGKDQKYHTKNLPLNLDDKTTEYFRSYFDRKNLNFVKNKHIIKGDLHQFSINQVRGLRYVNVPSIMGGSVHSEMNYNTVDAGGVIEILNEGKISTQQIIFNL